MVGIGGRGGRFRILEVSCTLFWVVSDSSQESHLLVNLFLKVVSFVEYFVIELLLLMFEFEVWVHYWALLLLYQENMEQMGYDLRMRNPVCLYLNLDMRYIQLMFGMNELN